MKEELLIYWELFRDPFLASVIAGLVLPLVGALVFLRRSVFLGVAVPQFSAAGLSLGLLLLPWFPALWAHHLDHGHPPMEYMFAFAAVAAAGAMWFYGWLETRARGAAEGRLAAGFALALALQMAFLAASPVGQNLAETLLHGEALFIDRHGLIAVATLYAVVLGVLVVFRRALLLVAFDPEAAVALDQSLARWDRVQMLVVGLAIGGGVTTLGPVLVFGLLFLPPIAARQTASTLRGFLRRTALVGVLATLLGWPLSLYFQQLPYGAAVVLVAGAIAFLHTAAAHFSRRGGRRARAA